MAPFLAIALDTGLPICRRYVDVHLATNVGSPKGVATVRGKQRMRVAALAPRSPVTTEPADHRPVSVGVVLHQRDEVL